MYLIISENLNTFEPINLDNKDKSIPITKIYNIPTIFPNSI